MTTRIIAALLACAPALIACHRKAAPPVPDALQSSGWIETSAVQRGHIEPGDIAQFGCPPGWMGVDDTEVAVRRRHTDARYMGTAPPPRAGTLTCVAQREFALPPPYAGSAPDPDAFTRPLLPVSLTLGVDSTTIVFRREMPPTSAIYLGQDTPCGPRLIGVRLGDLLKWLENPHSAPKRDFLGMVSAGCPEWNAP
jgi:hypothetical protein